MNAAAALTRQDLPQVNAQFIAYGPPVRVGDPVTGEPVTIRPQTYVRYYPAIKVAQIKEGGRSGADTVAVHLDVESVGLREPIAAYLNPDDPVLPYLRSRHSQDAPLAIALETVRRAKTRTDKTPISPLTPIHALRGAKDRSGAGASMDASLDNVTNKVAMVDGRPSATIVSDPGEWKVLVANKSGDLPPEGWRYYAPGEDWTQIGTIVPAASAPARASSGPALDAGALKAVVQDALAHVLGEAGPAQVPGARDRLVVRGRFDEGKKWDARANDGRVNLGSYLVSNVGWVYDWSHEHLTTLHAGAAPEEEAVWALTDLVLTLADTVQADAYGHGAEPDRSAASHTEATRRVQWVITHRDLPYPHRGTSTEVQLWATQVATLAAGTLARAGRVVEEYFAARARAAGARRANVAPAVAPTAAPPTTAQPEEPVAAPPGAPTSAARAPRERLEPVDSLAASPEAGAARGYPAPVRVVVHAAMAARTLEDLTAVHVTAQAQGLLDEQVWAKPHPVRGVTISAAEQPGFVRRSLADVLDRRRRFLGPPPGAPAAPPPASGGGPRPPAVASVAPSATAETSSPVAEAATSHAPSRSPRQTAFPQEDLFADATPDDSPDARAQAMAERARDTTAADLQALLEKATEDGLLDIRITAGGHSGPLRAYLRHQLKARHGSYQQPPGPPMTLAG